MRFSGRRLVLSGIALGMIVSFLLTQPLILQGFLSLTAYLYSFLPESVARFLRGQTYVSFIFVWALIFFGVGAWLVRGDFFRAETDSRRERFDVVNEDSEEDHRE